MFEALLPQAIECTDQAEVTKHAFCDGIYRREYFLPAGHVVVSKMHAHENWFLLFSGEISIYSGDGTTVRVKAPYMAKTAPGTKRIVFAHDDATMYTFHCNPDNEMDPKALESRYVVPEAPATLPPHVMSILLGRN